jgi:hypothetical protein
MRLLTNEQKEMVRGDMSVRLLVVFYLDYGTYAFCDDVMDCTDGKTTYIGASALTSSIEITSGDDLAAEPVTLICDGNRMEQFGITDPARVLRDIMNSIAQQRRVDFFLGCSPVGTEQISLRIPIYAGKINSYRMVDPAIAWDSKEESNGQLEIVIDALASRYSRSTNRTRSHEDQQEISPGDMFYSFTLDSVDSEQTLYWGKNAPYGQSRWVTSNVSIFGRNVKMVQHV